MKNFWICVYCVSASISALFAIDARGDRPLTVRQDEETIIALMNALDSEPSPTERYSLAARLDQSAKTVGSDPASSVHEATVMRIAALLDDPVEIVRLCAAEALGHLGARANVAVPALNKALARAKHDREIQHERAKSSHAVILSTNTDIVVTIETSLRQIRGPNGPGSGPH